MTPSTERNKATRKRRKDKGMVEVRVWLDNSACTDLRMFGVAIGVNNPTPANVIKKWAESLAPCPDQPPF